ncbi:MAG: polymer-forming cytoskeletal protein [Bryobacteraceae bacterium]|nr:polymer-forming cytoskeletal protein [Bryobacteraceae bacterium]
MSCPSMEDLEMFAAGELSEAGNHVAGCPACREVTSALAHENTLLAAALAFEPSPWPPLAPLSSVIASAIAVRAGWALWPDMLPEFLRLLDPAAFAASAAFRAAAWLRAEGLLMLLSAAALLFCARFARRGLAALLLFALAAVPSHALIRRAGEAVEVAAAESVADSVLALGDTVTIAGTVQGNLFSFARRVEVRGRVTGSLIALAERIELREGAVVEGDIIAGAGSVQLDRGSRLGGGVIAGSDRIRLAGEVGRAVLAGADSITAAGAVKGEFRVSAGELILEPAARLEGGLRAELASASGLRRSPEAVVSGADEVTVEGSEYAEPFFYVWAAAQFAGTLLIAWLWWRISPATLARCTDAARLAWRSAAVGLAVMVLAPVAALLLAISLAGLPLAAALIALLVWGALLATIPVARLIAGGRIPGAMPQLVLGLLLITIAVRIPFAGSVISAAIVLVGLGACAWEAAHAAAGAWRKPAAAAGSVLGPE